MNEGIEYLPRLTSNTLVAWHILMIFHSLLVMQRRCHSLVQMKKLLLFVRASATYILNAKHLLLLFLPGSLYPIRTALFEVLQNYPSVKCHVTIPVWINESTYTIESDLLGSSR